MKGEINLLVRIAVALFIVFCLVTIIDLQIRMNNLDKQKEADRRDAGFAGRDCRIGIQPAPALR